MRMARNGRKKLGINSKMARQVLAGKPSGAAENKRAELELDCKLGQLVGIDGQLGRITAGWRGVGGEQVYQVTMLSGAIKNRWAHEINFAPLVGQEGEEHVIAN